MDAADETAAAPEPAAEPAPDRTPVEGVELNAANDQEAPADAPQDATPARRPWAQIGAFADACTRAGRRLLALPGAVIVLTALGCVAIAGAVLLIIRAAAEPAPAAPQAEADPAPAALPMRACERVPQVATADGSAPPQRIQGDLQGVALVEALRTHGLPREEIYRIRRAFEGVAGWGASSAGRFAATLDETGKVQGFLLVVSPAEIYRARLDDAGELTGERAGETPEVRPCFGALRVAGGVAHSLSASTFEPDILPALTQAFGERVDLAQVERGASLRVIARELLVGDAFAGYDGVMAAEYRPPDQSAPALRVYRVASGGVIRYVDDDGSDAAGSLSADELDAFRAARAELAARLEAIPPPTSDPAAEAAADDDARRERSRPRASSKDSPAPSGGGRTLVQAAGASCSTSVVAGLSRQIIEEARCLDADAFVRVPGRKNLIAGDNVFLYLEAPARDHLLRALDAHPERTMTVNSALRTIAQQVLLAKWGETKRCGVKLAALPGESNHESGLALDVREASIWRTALEAEGFRWMGSKDPVHFDYQGARAVDHRGLDVRAFQRLWTRNHPDDPLRETGRLDARTAARLARAPASGFRIGARCGS